MEKRTAGTFESRKGPTAEQSATGSPARRRHQFPHLIAHSPKLPSSKRPPHHNHDVQRLPRGRTPSQALPDHPPHIVPRYGDPTPPGHRDPQPGSAPGLARSSGHRHVRPGSPRRLFKNRPVFFRPSQGRPPLHECPSPLVRHSQPLSTFRPSPLQDPASRLRLHSLPEPMNLLAPQIRWLPICNRHRLPPPTRDSAHRKKLQIYPFRASRSRGDSSLPQFNHVSKSFIGFPIPNSLSVFTNRLLTSEKQ